MFALFLRSYVKNKANVANKRTSSAVMKWILCVCEPTGNGFNLQTAGGLHESHRRREKASSSEVTTQEAYLCRRACSWPFQCQDGKRTPAHNNKKMSKTTTTKKKPTYASVRLGCSHVWLFRQNLTCSNHFVSKNVSSGCLSHYWKMISNSMDSLHVAEVWGALQRDWGNCCSSTRLISLFSKAAGSVDVYACSNSN